MCLRAFEVVLETKGVLPRFRLALCLSRGPLAQARLGDEALMRGLLTRLQDLLEGSLLAKPHAHLAPFLEPPLAAHAKGG